MLLCISMITALCGISAFAENTAVAEVGGVQYTSLEDAFAKAVTGDTVKLLADGTVNKQIAVRYGAAVTLDLGGHNVTSSDSITPFLVEGGELKVTGNGTVTSKLITFRSHANTDPKTMNENPLESILTIDSGVTVVSTGQCAVFYKGSGSVVNVYGTLEAKGPYATISGNGSLDNTTNNGGTVLNINSGAVIKSLGESTAEARDNCAIYHPQSGTINVNGGELSSQYGSGIEMRDGSLNISGGTITSYAGEFTCTPNGNGATTKGAAVAIAMHPNGNRAAKVNITGGKLTAPKALAYSNPNNAKNPDVTINVTGGTFSTAITDALTNAEVKSNFDKLTVVKDDNGYTYSVSDAAVAEVGGVPYTSLEDAFNAAYYGDCTIKLLKNAEMSGMATFDLSDGNLILDLNGHDINFTGNTANVASITVTNTRHNLKITGEGTITAEGRALEINSQGTIMTPGLIIDKDVTVISKSEVAIFLWTYNSDVNVYGTVKSLAEDAGAIMGNGNYTLGENKISIYDGAWVEARSHAIYCPQTGSLNITGGTIKSTGTTAIEMRRGTLNVSGNPTITTEATSYSVKENKSGATTVGAAVAIAPYDTSTMNISISGGTFTGKEALSYANPNKVANPDVTINVTGGTFSTDITEALSNAEVTSNLDDISIVEAGGKFTVGSYVAQAGNTKYTSLEAAFAKAATGDTITLLDNAKVHSRISINNGKKLTLDLNGHNITNNGCRVFQIYNDGKLDVTGTGKIETTGSYLPFIVQSNITNSEEKIDSVLTIGENVEVISNDYCAIFYIGNGAVVNVRGTVNALGEYAAIQGNGQYSVKDDNNWGRTTLNIYPGAVVTANLTTIYHPQFGGEVNVTGGVITSKDACAIEMRAGELNVSGDAVIETKATKFEYASNNNGSTTRGAAVAAALYQDRIISINISGGTYKGVKALSYENPNSVVNPDVTINVTGGTFSTDITDALTNADVKSNIKEYTVAANADGTYGVKARDEKFEKVAAVQRNTNNTLTFLAGINYLDYEKAGFRVTVGNNTKEVSTGTVYTKLDNNGKTSVSVDDFKTNYFFAADFEVLDTSITEFTITPFAKLLNGEEVTGTETKVKVGGAE